MSEVRRLAGRYALVACVSGPPGRGGGAARRRRGRRLRRRPRSRARSRGRALAGDSAAVRRERWPWLEDKGLTVAFHWREAPDEEEARRELEAVAERARAAGLVARWGRKVLELRPPVEADKGTAVRTLLAERGLERALYAGDDTTDLDAFRGLDGLELAVRVAVASPEGPGELREAADLVVGSPAELLELLRTL